MVNVFILALAVLAGGKIYAATTPQSDKKTQTPDSGLPNISDRPQKQTRTIDVTADFLYWHATEVADWAYTNIVDGDLDKIAYKTITFGWDPGFRVGVGYNMEHDGWDTQFYYTWFHTQSSKHADGDTGGIITAFLGGKLSGTGPYKTASIDWDIHFNMFDWHLGRRFSVSKSLSLRPFIGLKGGWINQKINTDWQNPHFDFLGDFIVLNAAENLKNDFRGIGPKGGLDTKWILGNVDRTFFSLVGNFAASYLWGHWHITDEFHDSLLTEISTKVADRNFGAFVLQGFMGFGFDFNFDNDRSHFSAKLGYEIQDWFSQYQVVDDGTGTHNNELLLQGGTLSFRVDF